MKKVTETIKLTGEIVEFNPKTETELIEAYRLCSEIIKAYEAAKKKLAAYADPYIGPQGTSEPVNGFMWRHMSVQRSNYDKSILREVIQDEDTLDLLLVPDKKAVDEYLKEHVEELGSGSTLLRKTMVPTGNPYSVTKLEKVSG